MPFIFLMTMLAIMQITVAFIQAIYQMKINGKIAMVGNSSCVSTLDTLRLFHLSL